ncbi:hypothetical protein L2D08_21825 [Domibacillus sp. PGB-M46]|uniref:hypothetical protein n=1 Tax=Domibacillus sp. PGB-M46 TaxID=2910255 RepID=UPI001F56632B|nr:hypothetical protein [Domibacillus sp. PGB-M46]MCI2256971.1 hypothetical protein [Domibacillus sp. PGB-M46]
MSRISKKLIESDRLRVIQYGKMDFDFDEGIKEAGDEVKYGVQAFKVWMKTE